MHFFIEQSKIDSQPVRYGPVPGVMDTHYRITSPFNLTANAKAFACQGGSILVLPSTDPALVNVILKPDMGLRIAFPAVKYYIYRGLLKDSFISGTDITPKATSNSDFITSFWRQFELYKLQKPATPNPLPAVFGYLPALDEHTAVEVLFSDPASPILPQPIILNTVKEGNWIGNFGTTAGLEIVVEDDQRGITLGYLKKTEYIINISSFPSSTPAEQFTLRAEKEKVLNYIDPAAFWGMHYKAGMYVYDATATIKKRKVSLDEIYFEVMNKYLTKNRVYLDIRSEKGYSYNFYTNYGDSSGSDLRFKIPADTGFSNKKYNAVWPIFMHHFGRDESPDTSKFIIQLRVDDNTKPLLFFENDELINNKTKENFIDDGKLLNGTATDWTNEIKLRFRNVNDPEAGERLYIGNYLQLHYFRNSGVSSTSTKVFIPASLPDYAFGGIDQLNIALNNKSPFLYFRNSRRSFVKASNFSYVAETGMFYNQQLVMLYARSVFADQKTREFFPLIDGSVPPTLLIDSPMFLKDILFEKWKLRGAGASEEKDTIKIAGTFSKNKQADKQVNKEARVFLGLTRTEFDTLTAVTGFHPGHNRYLVFEEMAVPFTDITGISYKAFSVKLTGYNPDGTIVIFQNPLSSVTVYTLDERVFFSAEFAQQSSFPYSLPDPGLMKDNGIEGPLIARPDVLVSIKDRIYKKKDDALKLTEESAQVQLWRNICAPKPLPTAKLPLVLIVHGNGHYLNNYDELSKFLAGNGFLVITVNCLQTKKFTVIKEEDGKHYFQSEGGTYFYKASDQKVYQKKSDGTEVETSTKKGVLADGKVTAHLMGDMCAFGRRQVIAEHVKELKGSSIKDLIDFTKIALIGHSRGGEAVVAAAMAEPGFLPADCFIKSVISLAPSDQYDRISLERNIPFFVLYGSRDGDISGAVGMGGKGRTSGFSLYDRAINNSEKSMAFVYGATHNGFITANTKGELEKLGYKDGKPPGDELIKENIMQHITKAYMNAFLRMTLRNERFWQPLFTGEQKPKSLAPANHKGIFLQYQAPLTDRKTIDDFDKTTSPFNEWTHSTIGGEVKGKIDASENELVALHSTAPHNTRGLKIKWKSDNKISFVIPAAEGDLHEYKFISFRIAKIVKSKQELEDLRVELLDGNDKMRYVKTNNTFLYDDFVIPAPDIRPDKQQDQDVSKSALMTVRIPLQLYEQAGFLLNNIKELSFVFPKGSGEVLIDNVEFTKQ